MDVKAYIESLPVSNFPDIFNSLSEFRKHAGQTIIVLDDDPTGCQTVHDVPVLFHWDEEILADLLDKDEGLIFLLTNSRSLPEKDAIRLYEEIRDLLVKLCKNTGKRISVVSRSDSTLRGHYPAEPYALHSLFPEVPVHVLIPTFFQGGRITVNDEHYVRIGDEYLPASSSPFAADKVFGFKHSNLKDYVEEKTGGKVRSEQVFSFDVEALRTNGPAYVAEKLQFGMPGAVAIVNAVTQNDLDIFALGASMAEESGKPILYRTAASFLNSLAAILPLDPLEENVLVTDDEKGGAFIAGSYVPKTTAQLDALISQTDIVAFEVNVERLLDKDEAFVQEIIKRSNDLISTGKNVLIYTSRELVHVKDEKENLDMGNRISEGLVTIGKALAKEASFIVAKGGITSHDIASKGIGMKVARVIGQALPGVPVIIPEENKKMKYIIFPGNVGDDYALVDLYNKLV